MRACVASEVFVTCEQSSSRGRELTHGPRGNSCFDEARVHVEDEDSISTGPFGHLQEGRTLVRVGLLARLSVVRVKCLYECNDRDTRVTSSVFRALWTVVVSRLLGSSAFYSWD